MQDILSSALDEAAIYEIISEMDSPFYSDELMNYNYFHYFAELFIDISAAASQLRDKLYYMRLPEQKNYRDHIFNLATISLNYTEMDYLLTTESYSSAEAEEDKQDIVDKLSKYSKKEQRQLFIKTLDFMVEFQELKATYKTLVYLLREFDSYKNLGIEAFLGGHDETN